MRKKKSSEHPRKVNFGGIELKVCMTKVRNFAEITPNLPFSEFNFYELYRATFENSELGRMKKILPLHEMAESFGLVSKSMMPRRGRKSYFTPEGKLALMFLKMKTQMRGTANDICCLFQGNTVSCIGRSWDYDK